MLITCLLLIFLFFFFNDTATTEIYTLSLHDALPIYSAMKAGLTGIIRCLALEQAKRKIRVNGISPSAVATPRSEEHTSELQSLAYLVCRLLLEKKKTQKRVTTASRTSTRSYTHATCH